MPAAHLLHGTGRPGAALKVPAAQLTQVLADVAPTALDHVPEPQFVHDVAAVDAEYVPATHLTHVVFEFAPKAFELVPMGQLWQAAEDVAPTAVEKRPAAQGVQEDVLTAAV